MPSVEINHKRQALFLEKSVESKVLYFSPRIQKYADVSGFRFSIVDRMAVYAWVVLANDLSFTRLVFEQALQTDGVPFGEYLSIYARDSPWSCWGVGCDADGVTLWHAPRGKTIGRFETVRGALDRIREITLGI